MARAPVFRAPPRFSPGVITFYLVLLGLLTYLGVQRVANPLVAEFLIALLFLYLARYLSTRYRLDSRWFIARRLFGSRRMALAEIRHATAANLRDLGPVSLIGAWGWRGRMWSSQIGSFDTVHTISDGVLVLGEGAPVFISPRDPEGFLLELSRRARSFHPDLDILTGPV